MHGAQLTVLERRRGAIDDRRRDVLLAVADGTEDTAVGVTVESLRGHAVGLAAPSATHTAFSKGLLCVCVHVNTCVCV